MILTKVNCIACLKTIAKLYQVSRKRVTVVKTISKISLVFFPNNNGSNMYSSILSSAENEIHLEYATFKIRNFRTKKFRKNNFGQKPSGRFFENFGQKISGQTSKMSII